MKEKSCFAKHFHAVLKLWVTGKCMCNIKRIAAFARLCRFLRYSSHWPFIHKVSCIVRTLVLRKFIFILYQVWLLIRPKFSRKFIQRADVLHTVCFPACLLEICANVWKANAGFFFLVYSTCMIFFFTKFSLAWIFFFCTLPAHHNFSNDSSLTLNSTGKSKQPNCQENQYMHLSSKKNLEIR